MNDTRQEHWTPPPAGSYKITVDVGIARSGEGGSVSAVCRNTQGIFITTSFLVIYGVTNPTTLEVMTCREALALVDDLLLGSFIVGSGCKQALLDIKRGD